MNINEQIEKLKVEIEEHNKALNDHSFNLKAKQAKLRKLEKSLEKINEILNEPISE